jgi:hypothetical protein
MSYRIKLALASVALVYALSGCVSTKTVAVDQNVLTGFRGATIVASQREKPTFVANTAGKFCVQEFRTKALLETVVARQ